CGTDHYLKVLLTNQVVVSGTSGANFEGRIQAGISTHWKRSSKINTKIINGGIVDLVRQFAPVDSESITGAFPVAGHTGYIRHPFQAYSQIDGVSDGQIKKIVLHSRVVFPLHIQPCFEF